MLSGFYVFVVLRRRNITYTEIVILIARLRIDQPDAHQLFGMRERKSAQYDCVNHRELRHGAANPKRKHQNGEETKDFVLQKDTNSDTDVLAERFEHNDDLVGVEC